MGAQLRGKHANIVGWLLIVIGVVVVVLSPKIVFPGLEIVLGIERIVGAQNVVYRPDGSYVFTNPGAMMKWIGLVALVGVSCIALGCVILLYPSLSHLKGGGDGRNLGNDRS
jgi:hypothetical protein